MKIRIMYVVASIMYLGLTACDDTTDTLGDTLTHSADKFTLIPDTFGVVTRSMTVDSVLATNVYPYVGHVKDTETGSYVTSSFTSQFGVVAGRVNSKPKEDSLRCEIDENGNYIASGCRLGVFINSYVGDSLNTLKVTLHELAKPLEEGINYYSNFDITDKGYLRKDGKELKAAKSFTYEGLAPETTSSAITYKSVEFDLNALGEYVDKNGNKYRNYGSYLLNMLYKHPEHFSSSYNFIHNVCPGFYFEQTNGIGNMGEIVFVSLFADFQAISGDTLTNMVARFSGTEEVMQTTFISSDKERMAELAADMSCTYLKSPSGLFTEMELPIDSIKSGHENDTISSVKIVIPRYNYETEEALFTAPSSVLMLPKDSLYTFFEKRNIPDSKMSFLASYNSSLNTYTYNNIADLVNKMWQIKQSGKGSDDWNKVVLLPVTVTTNSSTSSTSTTVTNVTNDIGLKSTRLVRGTNFLGRDGKDANGNPVKASPLKLSVLYNKFRD